MKSLITKAVLIASLALCRSAAMAAKSSGSQIRESYPQARRPAIHRRRRTQKIRRFSP